MRTAWSDRHPGFARGRGRARRCGQCLPSFCGFERAQARPGRHAIACGLSFAPHFRDLDILRAQQSACCRRAGYISAGARPAKRRTIALDGRSGAGGAERNRTAGLCSAIAALSHLSYSPRPDGPRLAKRPGAGNRRHHLFVGPPAEIGVRRLASGAWRPAAVACAQPRPFRFTGAESRFTQASTTKERRYGTRLDPRIAPERDAGAR